MAKAKRTPVRIDSSKTRENPMEELFSIDDDQFFIPVEVPPNVTLKFIRDMRGGQMEVAVAKALDNLIGADAVDRLADCEALEADQLKQIMDVIEEKMMAASAAMQGN